MTVKRRNHGTGHSYYDVDEHGHEHKLDGVTTLLRDGIPKGGLTSWAAEQAATYAIEHWDELAPLPLLERGKEIQWAWQRERDRLAIRGQEIHALAERLTHGEEVDVPDELEAHVEQCIKFLDQYKVRPVVTETVVVNRSIGYAGTLDLVADLAGPRAGGRYLIDWKTGRSVYPETALQLAAYAHAEHYVTLDGAERPVAELGIQRGLMVHLRADDFDVYPMRIDELAYRVFRHVAYVARWVRWDRDTRTSPLDAFKASPLEVVS